MLVCVCVCVCVCVTVCVCVCVCVCACVHFLENTGGAREKVYPMLVMFCVFRKRSDGEYAL